MASLSEAKFARTKIINKYLLFLHKTLKYSIFIKCLKDHIVKIIYI